MLKSLQTFAARFGLTDAVHFAGAQEDMPRVFNELDVVVTSSHSEAMPLAVMEAMASGLPVVACKVGGVPDLVAHGSPARSSMPATVTASPAASSNCSTTRSSTVP
jgi:glycosyltransferase involved in cell wall biosynthesis